MQKCIEIIGLWTTTCFFIRTLDEMNLLQSKIPSSYFLVTVAVICKTLYSPIKIIIRCEAFKPFGLLLPMIDMSASDPICILSTMEFIAKQADELNITPVLTFDQPLYQKAVEIQINELDTSLIIITQAQA